MNLLEQEIFEAITELKGMSADQITHFLKNYNGIEHESMADGLLHMFLDLKVDRSKTIKSIMVSCGISFTVAIAIVVVICVVILKNARKKDNEKINEIIEQLKSAKNVDVVETEEKYESLDNIQETIEANSITAEIDLDNECPQCGKTAQNVDEITSMFGYKESEDFELAPEVYCKECRGDK